MDRFIVLMMIEIWVHNSIRREFGPNATTVSPKGFFHLDPIRFSSDTGQLANIYFTIQALASNNLFETCVPSVPVLGSPG